MPALPPLYPEIEPFHTGHLNVGQGHTIYFEQSGNPKGTPILILHGGPGGSISSKYHRFANPKTCHTITFDQRGCGKSTPFTSLKDNTTAHLLTDIEKLREHLNIKSWIVMGSSWGSTLGLAYAQAHPQRVTGIVVGGIFLSTKAEYDWMSHPTGMPRFYPVEYTALLETLGNPKPAQLYTIALQALTGKNKAHATKVAKAFARYEFTAAVREPNHAQAAADIETIPEIIQGTPIELHYIANKCFLKPNQLLNNLHRIAHIPLHIVQGAYDMICPPAAAITLHAAHPNSTLHWLPQSPHYGDPLLDTTRVQALKQVLKQAKA